MSYAAVAARIGAIEANLSRVAGTVPGATSRGTPAATAPQVAATEVAAQAAGFAQLLDNAVLGGGTAVPNSMAAGAMSASVKNAPSASMLAGTVSGATRAEAAAPPAVQQKPQVQAKEPAGAVSGADGGDVVAASKKYLGVPYVWGGNNPAVGLDCSSFVQHTFRDLGIELPRVARQQAKEGTEVPTLAQAKPGDLIVTRGGGHIGIYLGENRMIHAPRPGEQVSIRELFETDKDIMTIRRIVPSQAADTALVQAQGQQLAAAQRASFNHTAGGAS